MSFTFPNNVEDQYAKGTFISDTGEEVYAEISATFNEDGTCDIEKTQLFIDNSIRMYNIKKNGRVDGN